MFNLFTSTWNIIIAWFLFVLKILQQIHCVVLSSFPQAALSLVCWGRNSQVELSQAASAEALGTGGFCWR